MFKIKILTIGKNKEKWLQEALDLYTSRLRAIASISFMYIKDNHQLISLLKKESYIILLDSQGKHLSSTEFHNMLYEELEKNGSHLTFVIGGPEGLPKSLLTAHHSISLSSLTFTHQIARLILLEQIYRATEIAKGSQYHK